MKKKRSPLPEGDDGKVIAKMDVDGMPWYLEKLHRDEGPVGEAYQMNKKESRSYMLGALAAAFLVTAFFGTIFALIILFLIYVWK